MTKQCYRSILHVGLIIASMYLAAGCSASKTSTSTESSGEYVEGNEKLGKDEKEDADDDEIVLNEWTEVMVFDTIERTVGEGETDSSWTINSLSLDIYEKEIPDTSESASFRFHVRNSSDSLAVIDRVQPSCGCIMATVQKSFAGQGKEGEIYVGLVVTRMSDVQPYTIDVYTTLNPTTPLRLTIRKVAVAGHERK